MTALNLVRSGRDVYLFLSMFALSMLSVMKPQKFRTMHVVHARGQWEGWLSELANYATSHNRAVACLKSCTLVLK